ncbi:MAG: hypothetical protein ACJ735_10645 [Actinomycetes bacterium]
MSRDRDRRDEVTALEMSAVAVDDAALDVLASAEDAVSWDCADPAIELLAFLRADVSAALPEPTSAAAAIDLRPPRGRHFGKRTVVAGVVTAAVLSVSGVAAAAIATSPTGPLGPIHRFFVGSEPTASEHAAKQVQLFMHLADADLSANRVTAAGSALGSASSWLTRVSAKDRGDLPAQLAALQTRYADALARSITTPKPIGHDGKSTKHDGSSKSGTGNGGHDGAGSSSGGGDHGKDSHEGSGGSGSGDNSTGSDHRGDGGGSGGSGDSGSGHSGDTGSGDITGGQGSGGGDIPGGHDPGGQDIGSHDGGGSGSDG